MDKNNRAQCKSNKLCQELIRDFGEKINLARKKLISLMMVALCKAQTVNLNRLAIACESEVKSASVLRRIQRFHSSYVLAKDLVA